MLVSQLYAAPFARLLSEEWRDAERVDVATAWVRASGVALVWTALDEHLRHGGKLRIVAGIDHDNTSAEGLSMLLDLPGDVKVWVRHNEAGPIFHPKMYAARSAEECRVLVGSNNLTGAGLSRNEELSGMLTGPREGPLEGSLKQYMAELTSVDGNLVRRLDHDFLHRLVAAGYVDAEAGLKGKSAGNRKSRPKDQRLFGSKQPKRVAVPVPVPVPDGIEPSPRSTPTDWHRIFVKMRLSRGTQGQLPVQVVRAIRERLGLEGLDGQITIFDRHNRGDQQVSPTFTARNPDVANTYKIEAFAAEGEPLVKLELVGRQVLADFYDTAKPDGRAVYDFMLNGLLYEPPLTIVPKGNAVADAGESLEEAVAGYTLYRFD